MVYVATAMPGPGVVRHHGRGDLVIGPLTKAGADDTALGRKLQDVVAFFATANVPVRISPDVMAELWAKLMVNCAYNAISGIAQASYGELAVLEPVVRCSARSSPRSARLPLQKESTCRSSSSLEAMEKIAPAMPAQPRRRRRTWRATSRARSIT